MPLNKKLLHLLACPICHKALVLLEDESGLECPSCGLVYPIRDGIPVMLKEEAKKKEPQ